MDQPGTYAEAFAYQIIKAVRDQISDGLAGSWGPADATDTDELRLTLPGNRSAVISLGCMPGLQDAQGRQLLELSWLESEPELAGVAGEVLDQLRAFCEQNACTLMTIGEVGVDAEAMCFLFAERFHWLRYDGVDELRRPVFVFPADSTPAEPPEHVNPQPVRGRMLELLGMLGRPASYSTLRLASMLGTGPELPEAIDTDALWQQEAARAAGGERPLLAPAFSAGHGGDQFWRDWGYLTRSDWPLEHRTRSSRAGDGLAALALALIDHLSDETRVHLQPEPSPAASATYREEIDGLSSLIDAALIFADEDQRSGILPGRSVDLARLRELVYDAAAIEDGRGAGERERIVQAVRAAGADEPSADDYELS